MKIGRYLLLAIIAGIALILGPWIYLQKGSAAPPSGPNQVELPVFDDSAYNTRAPPDIRIKVEVLNATDTRGLARRATQYLRDRGFDVVAMGNSKEKYDHTIVYNRSNNKTFATLVARAMSGRLEERPDTSRYLDVTVLVGSDWAPPTEPFYP